MFIEVSEFAREKSLSFFNEYQLEEHSAGNNASTKQAAKKLTSTKSTSCDSVDLSKVNEKDLQGVLVHQINAIHHKFDLEDIAPSVSINFGSELKAHVICGVCQKRVKLGYKTSKVGIQSHMDCV